MKQIFVGDIVLRTGQSALYTSSIIDWEYCPVECGDIFLVIKKAYDTTDAPYPRVKLIKFDGMSCHPPFNIYFGRFPENWSIINT